MKRWIRKVAEGQDLNPAEAAASMTTIMDGEATDAQIAALLMALRMKGETVDEIASFAAVMRRRAVRLGRSGDDLFDLCGTGGDGTSTINISTLASLVVAAEGVAVAKHGNRSISSRCGSADLLELLGVRLEVAPEIARRCLDEAGICFLYAPQMHPAMRHAAAARRDMGVRTLFNLLGPLTNPALVSRQLVGVFDAGRTEVLARALDRLGAERALVVHGAGGMDEVSLAGPTRVSELDGGAVRTYEIRPGELGLDEAPLDAVRGGDPEENVRIAREILEGMEGPRADVVALNAGVALYAAGSAATMAAGVERARACLRRGAAGDTLERLRQAAGGP